MKRRRALPDPRLAGAAVGASVLAIPASAAGVGDAPAIAAHIHSHVVDIGQNMLVSGSAPGLSGHTVGLEFAPAGASAWRRIASGRVASGGSFRLSAPLLRSGAVKVVDASPEASGAGTWLVAATTSAGTTASSTQRVSVAADFRLRPRHLDSLGGGAIHVRGRLLPEMAGRRVVLQVWHAGRWATVSRARTGGRGGFDLRYRPQAAGREVARVRFAGDPSNGSASSRAGMVAVYRESMASWYDDGGTTACGFHAPYGVANVSLPCGAKVSLAYGGRRVTATVDDRGPYVGGRQWDLNQNTAAALGFGGVAPVWSSS